MKRGYVVHDNEVSEVMTELAVENMPGVAWVFTPDEATESPAQRNNSPEDTQSDETHFDVFTGISWVVCRG